MVIFLILDVINYLCYKQWTYFFSGNEIAASIIEGDKGLDHSSTVHFMFVVDLLENVVDQVNLCEVDIDIFEE